MYIQEMHTAFRTLGQQSGMQLLRGILPETIDIFLNDVIIEKAHRELILSVRTAIQDKIDTQSSSLNPINLYRNLYKTARYKIKYNNITDINKPIDGEIVKQLSLDANIDNAADKLDNGILEYRNEKNGYYIFNIPTINSSTIINNGEYKISPMMFLGFTLEYENTLRGNPVACRLIGADVLETTLRDYCNGASKDSPIACLSSISDYTNANENLNSISNEQVEIYTNVKDPIIYLNVKYIKNPNVVKYDIDESKCVHCDLPAYTHFEIVEQAVRKFMVSIGNIGQQSSQEQR